MKKSFTRIAGAFLTAIALFFAGCSNGTGYSAAIDTVMTLDAPTVTVTAYPGMNYVSWKSVTGATSYYLTVYEDGVERYSSGSSTRTYAQNYYVDTTLQDGHTYKYRVEAISKSNPSGSRAVYVKNSAAESKEVVAIVPMAGTEAIAFTELDKSKNSEDFIVNPDAINVSTTKGYIRMSLPTKAYLHYYPYVKSEKYLNGLDSNNLSGATMSSLSYSQWGDYFRPSVNNVNPTNFSIAVSTPGVYTVGVNVYAATNSTSVYPYSNIVATKKITIPGVTTKVATSTLSYRWISTDKARLYWTPATLADDTIAKAQNYILYTWDADKYLLTKVEGEVKVESDDFYYFDVTPAEDTTYVVAYTEIVKNADDTETIYVESRSSSNKVTVTKSALPVATAPVSAYVTMNAGDDGIANDAVFTIQLAENTTLKSVKYAVTDASNTYAALLESEYKPVTFTTGDIYYEIKLAEDVDEGKYIAVKYEVAAEGYEDYVDYKVSATSSGVASNIAAAPTTSILPIDGDADGKVNDIKVAIKLADDTTLTSVVYTTSDVSAAKARLLLNNPSAIKAVPFEAGYAYNVLTISDIADGDYVAVQATIAKEGCKDRVVTLSTTTAINTAATTANISMITGNFVDADGDGITNDLEVFYELPSTQTIAMVYATADTTVEANNLVFSKDAKAITNAEVYADFGDIGAVYKVIIKDVTADDYVAIRYTLSEPTYNDYSDIYTTTTTSGYLTITDTADPSISVSTIVLNSDDSDANYNDATNDFTVEIAFDQVIKSISYAVFEESSIAADYALLGINTTAIALPTKYELKTTYDDPTVLTKVYTINPAVKNIADGKYIAVAITISEEGYNDVVKVITSANSAAQADVTMPNVTIGDAYNYEYVDVLVTDDYPFDDSANYAYTIEWTTEKEYNEGDPVWVKLPKAATKAIEVAPVKDDADNIVGYRYAKRYFIDTLGDYVIRVTKTRLAAKAVSGKAESVITDTKFTVVDIPCNNLIAFNISGGYEYVDLYTRERIYADYDDVNNYTYKLYEVAVTDNPETAENEVSVFLALDDDAKAAYVDANWEDSIAVAWTLDVDASDSVTESNNLAGYINPTVKIYTFKNRFVKHTPGLYFYKLTKKRSTPAELSTADLFTVIGGSDSVERIPNSMDVSSFYFTSANFGEASVYFNDLYDPDYDTVGNWKYELQYMNIDGNPSLEADWNDSAVTKTVVIPSTGSDTYTDLSDYVYNRTYFGKTISETPDTYYARVVKTRVATFVAADDPEKVWMSDYASVDIAYVPTLAASVEADTFHQFKVDIADKFNTRVDSTSNWYYVVEYYKAADAEGVVDGSVTPDTTDIYSLTWDATEGDVESDKTTVTFDINVPADTDYVVNVYKVPSGYDYTDYGAYSVSGTVTVKYQNTVTITADNANEIAYFVEDYVEDIDAVEYKVVYGKKAEPEVTAEVVIYPALNAAGRYEVSDVIDLSSASLTEATDYTVTVYKGDVVLKTVDVTVNI